MDRRDQLFEAALVLHSELSLPAVLQRMIEAATELVEARYGALGVIEDDRLVEFVTTGMSDEERAAIGEPPTGHGILGVLIEDKGTLRLPDIEADPRAHGFPPHHPPMHTFLGTAVRARGEVFGNIYLTEKIGGGEFTEDDERVVEVLAAQAGVAIENARLHEEAAQRERWLEASRDIANAILSREELPVVLELIAEHARALVGADLAAVHIPVAGTDQLVVEAASGVYADDLRAARFPIEGSISGEVVRRGRAVVVDDASSDPRAYQPIVRLGHIGPGIFVPLSAEGQAYGTLAAANLPGKRRFPADAVRVLESFAAQAALALDAARAQAELQRLAILDDRERIAKELHDGVIQALFAVGMGLQGTAIMSGDEDLAGRIEGAVGELDRVIRDLRNYIFGLRPGILADRQLDQALRQLGEEFQQKSGVVTIVDVDPNAAAELSAVAGDVVQLVRESLSNVGRHAEASTCRVSLYRREDNVVVEVDDDGTGFDPGTARRGEGLTNLENRAAALGGSALIESSPDQGTTVRLLLPV
ncbi:MAG TPA: GAF domain-containing protein [Actinomycetota bacterium]|nr:GAF domain-containing protein [Actinomycetota bacterium]